MSPVRFANCRGLSTLAFAIALATTSHALAQSSGSKASPKSQTSAAPSSSRSLAPKVASGVGGVVLTDGALVYSRPDFDSEVLGELTVNQRVLISRATYGSGPRFYKVKVGGKIGYVADIDVRPANAAASKDAKKPSAKTAKSQPAEKKPERKKPEETLPLYFTRYVGLLIGQSEFKKNISGVDASTQLTTFGLRMTGPDILWAGPVIDWSLALHYGAPSYYDRLSVTKPIGFVLWSDALFMLPLIYSDESVVSIGFGPMLTLSKFSVLNGGRNRDLTTLNLGVTFSLGGAIRFGKVALRLDGKYFIEKQSYKAVQASIQTAF